MSLYATFLAAATAVVAAAGGAAAAGGEGSCESGVSQQDPTALLQLHVKVQQSGDQFPNPIGRTYLSDKPSASAEYMVRYFYAAPVPLPDCDGSERAAVRLPAALASASRFPPYIIFMKADPMPSGGSVDFEGLVALLQGTLATAANGTFAYTFHLDDHEGMATTPVTESYDRQIEDGLVIAGYRHPVESVGEFDALVQIPHTLQTWQSHSYFSIPIKPVISDDCRLFKALFKGSEPSAAWKKSTFSAFDPAEAGSFAIGVLGAEMLETPYPADAPPGCTVAIWVALPGSGFNLHFVRASGAHSYDGEMASFLEGVRSLRNVTAGVVDAFMYSSLMLRVPSLDPYIERLRARGLPFLLLSAGPEFALLVNIPNNVITIQLRSDHVTAAAPEPSSAGCAFDFGPLPP